MKNNDIEAMLRSAVSHASPDALEDILSACDHEKGKVICMEKKKTSPLRTFAAAAAVFVLIAAGIFAAKSLGGSTAESLAAVISLDVNPSIELNVDKDKKIISAKGLNEDGVRVLDGMQLGGSDLDVAVNAVIGSMLKNGYIDDMANSILLSVSGVDGFDADALRAQLAEDVDRQLGNCSVLSQNVSEADSETAELADRYGITVGKAALISQIIAENPRHNFGELAELSVNELNLLADGRSLGNINSTGKASSKAYIGTEAATEKAIRHAGVTADRLIGLETELDYEYGSMVYEIEFTADGTEYEYDIDALTGDVLWFEKEGKGIFEQGGSVLEDTNTVGKDKAKQAALRHAGVKEADAKQLKIELDRDGGRYIYEIEFKYSGYEYEYEIDAASGSVLTHDKERDD